MVVHLGNEAVWIGASRQSGTPTEVTHRSDWSSVAQHNGQKTVGLAQLLIVGRFVFCRRCRHVPDRFEQSAVLKQSTHVSVANSTASRCRHAAFPLNHVLNRPMTDSAGALS